MFTSIAATYQKSVLPNRKELFGAHNIHAAPRIEKVVINSRVSRGGAVDEAKIMDTLSRITGQRAIATRARLSISNFKIREGQVVGGKVTLRGTRAIDFLDRLLHVTLPRVRDFSGLSTKGFDGHGNFTVGFSEHNVFPEVAGDDIAKLHGIEITVVTSAANDHDGLTLLKALGFPFKK
ncbi:MAG: 50S ribosomal protein L5 [Parcubacteria group bacterium]|nr:50S ribosomal protein L5 [Parcubacteria group bacterium]